MRHHFFRIIAYILGVGAIVIAGIYFGRLSVGQPAPPAQETKKEIPTLPPPPKATAWNPQTVVPESGKKLIVEVPIDNATVTGTLFDVGGRAKKSRTPVAMSLKDASGKELVSSSAAILIDGSEDFGRFAAALELPKAYTGAATLDVVWTSDDGTMTEKVTRHVKFADRKVAAINVFFGDGTNDGVDCSLVVSAKREVPVTGSVYRAALDALLAGPTQEEKDAAKFTSIPTGVKVLSISVDGAGKAVANFSRQLGIGVAGSCRVTAIRAQIERTLLQFPEVRSVVIQIEGNAETALQP